MNSTLRDIIDSARSDELVCVVTTPARFRLGHSTTRVVGRVWLEPGVGIHIVDVTDPASPCIVASPQHSSERTR